MERKESDRVGAGGGGTRRMIKVFGGSIKKRND